jgi:hypothetical protein
LVVSFSWAGFLFLVFFPAPAALGKFLNASLCDDDWPQAVMGLLRGDVVDSDWPDFVPAVLGVASARLGGVRSAGANRCAAPKRTGVERSQSQ